MRSVYHWKCQCGIRYKALTEVNEADRGKKNKVFCRHCRAASELAGTVIGAFEEVADDYWRPIDVAASPTQHTQPPGRGRPQAEDQQAK